MFASHTLADNSGMFVDENVGLLSRFVAAIRKGVQRFGKNA
jgi:hypothetical protein